MRPSISLIVSIISTILSTITSILSIILIKTHYSPYLIPIIVTELIPIITTSCMALKQYVYLLFASVLVSLASGILLINYLFLSLNPLVEHHLLNGIISVYIVSILFKGIQLSISYQVYSSNWNYNSYKNDGYDNNKTISFKPSASTLVENKYSIKKLSLVNSNTSLNLSYSDNNNSCSNLNNSNTTKPTNHKITNGQQNDLLNFEKIALKRIPTVLLPPHLKKNDPPILKDLENIPVSTIGDPNKTHKSYPSNIDNLSNISSIEIENESNKENYSNNTTTNSIDNSTENALKVLEKSQYFSIDDEIIVKSTPTSPVKSKIDLSYVHNLQNSPSKRKTSLKLQIKKSISTPESKESFPKEVIGEYDKEKWDTMVRLKLVD